jgi:RNA polymerase sigma-70 factor (family 1)
MIHLDDTNFQAFYKEYFSHVRTFVFAKCRDIDLAQDITQETFIRIWNNRTKVEVAKSKSYAFTVANNIFFDHVRHEKVERQYQQSFLVSIDKMDPSFHMEMKEYHQILENTIQNMPEGVREVFLLNRIEKMTYQQIADSLDLSVKAIEKRMQKALEMLSAFNIPRK